MNKRGGVNPNRPNQMELGSACLPAPGSSEDTGLEISGPASVGVAPHLVDRMLTLAEENVASGRFPYVGVITHGGEIIGEAKNPVKLPSSADDFPIFEKPTSDGVLKLCDDAVQIAEERFPDDLAAQAQFLNEIVVYTNTEPSTQGSFAMAGAGITKCIFSLDLDQEIAGSAGTVVPPVAPSEEIFRGFGLTPEFVGGIEVERALESFSAGWAKANEGIAKANDTVFSSKKSEGKNEIEVQPEFMERTLELVQQNVSAGKLPYAAILKHGKEIIAEASSSVAIPQSASDKLIRKPTDDPCLELAEQAYRIAKTRFPDDRAAQVEFLSELEVYTNVEPSNMGSIALGFAQITSVVYGLSHDEDLAISQGLGVSPVGSTEKVFGGANLSPRLVGGVAAEHFAALHREAWKTGKE